MKNEFIPYEQALKLKQLGFDGLCFGYWNIDPHFETPFLNFTKPFNHEWCLPAPTLSQAFRWFREKYALYVELGHRQRIDFYYTIYENSVSIAERNDYSTYEEAENACLKRLIEIAKK